MGLSMDDCTKLKAAGYSEHDIAQVAKVPTPAIVKLARYGMAPQQEINIDVDGLLKAKAVKPIELGEKAESTKKEGK
jgi:predicted transcriptional regulator